MIDVFILLFLAFLLLRGWYRGFVREAMDLTGLVLGTLFAFRLGGVVGSVVTAMSGISPDVGRLTGGVIVFVGTGIGAAILARRVERHARMPGLNLMNRVGGAGLAMATGVFAVTLMLTLGVVLPMPPAVAGQLDDSAVTQTLTNPDGVPQELFTTLAGDRIVETLINMRRTLGVRRVILEGEDVVALPAAEADDLLVDWGSADEVFELVNRARIDEGLDPLAWSPALSQVGLGHAVEMYVEGHFSHVSPDTGTVGDRVWDAGITYRIAGENLALAATPTETHGGLMDSPGHRANILSPEYNRIGIGVVEGPLGLMTVQVFTG
ncbi:MAG TPA: CvpA family protein [Acidimicrobiia bacterium]|nr:CvpA family protein [Acidimicrobiia bacterium]